MKVLAIYAEAIKGPDATFETNVPTWSEWSRAHLPAHRLVAVDDANKVLGWTALSKVSERREYAGIVECHTFVRADARRTGVGTRLLTALVAATEGQGLWTVQAHVFPENEAAARSAREARLPHRRYPRSGWAATVAAGATYSCSNAGAPPSPDRRPFE